MKSALEQYHRLLQFNCWANGDVLHSLREMGEPPMQSLRWLAHIVGSEYLWLARLKEEPPVLAVWPELDLDGCGAWLRELESIWPRYLDQLDPEDLQDGRGYRNTKGEFWTNSVSDILLHVITHSHYHRGQIAASVRAAGGSPAYTDYIHAVRQGFIE
jgi:uncharacterized damage-inducible protein DinB